MRQFSPMGGGSIIGSMNGKTDLTLYMDPQLAARVEQTTAVRKVGRPRTEHCKQCGRHVIQCGSLSKRKLCVDCAGRNLAESLRVSSFMHGYARALRDAEHE